MRVEDGNEGVVVCDDYKVVQSSQKDVAFFDSPGHGQAFQLDDCITAFSVSEESGTSFRG